MNMPIFFDIAIGLFFIYLILSMLASELQELIATLHQWRAKHLEQAIESLLCGGSEYFSKNELKKAQSELGKAQKLLISLYDTPLINTLNQEATKRIAQISKQDNKLRNNGFISGRSSAPSYIPSETFASTLFNELKLPHLIEQAKKNQNPKANLILILSSYKDLKTAIQNPKNCTTIKDLYGEIDKDTDFKKLINELPDNASQPLIQSLEFLARRSQNKVEEIDEQLNQLRKEVETWFDRSMDRTTGVYKRKAKKVAIFIGIAIAILTNTDTFHIISRLSRDTALRTAITSSASQQAELYKNPELKNKIYQALDDVSLPIGWTDNNFKQQFGFTNPYKYVEQQRDFTKAYEFSFGNLLKAVRVFLGWLLSGLAIGMGAPVWFDLLGKVINLRNAGPRPVSYTKDRDSVSKS